MEASSASHLQAKTELKTSSPVSVISALPAAASSDPALASFLMKLGPCLEEYKRLVSEKKVNTSFPDIKFFSERSWTQAASTKKDNEHEFGYSKRAGRTATGEAPNWMGFIQHKDGTKADAVECKAIRDFINSSFGEIHRSGFAPDKWSRATNDAKAYLYVQLIGAFPYLAFCAGMWKVETLATKLYPDFKPDGVAKRRRSPSATPHQARDKRAKREDEEASYSTAKPTPAPSSSASSPHPSSNLSPGARS
jgi:hypothetical protein